ncbi:MAG TPA: ectonucleotide pyrophosphatase/phosphodiesterase [Vicinamibacterales bacterium]|nr:ectonucleotide pyrophosphatase/phosphodiesterase [Vicinamibacterales bacterium]
MRRGKTWLAGVSGVLAAAMLSLAAAQDDEARVVLISIDGLMPSSYTSADSARLVPNLARLAAGGAYADGVVGVLPTVTYPSHTTLITGVTPARHGIYDNRILDPENRSSAAWHWYARAIKVPTLPMAARARGLRAAGVFWPVTVGMDLDYVLPEYARSRHPESLTMLRALSWPRTFIDSVEHTRQRPFDWPLTDRDRTDFTTFLLRTVDPHVLLVHLIDLDTAQHEHGPGSREANEMLARIDGYVGEIAEAVRSAGRADRTHLVVVSDHGFLPLQQQVQPNAAFKREGLLRVNDRGDVVSWDAYFHSSGGAGFVYLRDPAVRPRVEAILRALQADGKNGIREVWTAEELKSRGAHPEAAFGLDVVDGFYTSAAHDVVVKPSTSRGGHGFAPDRTALHASFIIGGPSVQKRGSLGVIRMTSIAPTLAGILRVSLAPSDSPPLELGGK